ncbi:MAG: hypothetical protein L0Z50_28400 [Verrucomicrobiales bacterium]|nr:hypothetical protein [Verrucomicrobiales bacterium]
MRDAKDSLKKRDMAVDLAGLEPWQDKQKRSVIEEIRGEFFGSARARGHAPEKIEEVWGLVTGFAGYAFCKAHSTAYGVEAHQAAWLKRYFPAEFMAAVLTHVKGLTTRTADAILCA